MDPKTTAFNNSKSNNEPSISSSETQTHSDTKVQVLNTDSNNIKEETEGDSEDLLNKLSNKKTNRKIPNIAEELAKNRNYVKGASPSPVIVSTSSSTPPSGPPSSSTNSMGIPTNRFSKNTIELYQHSPSSAISTDKTDTEERRQNNRSIDNRNAPERGSSSFAANQLKISSLLTISSNDDSTSSHISDSKSNKNGNNATINNIPSAYTELHTDANSVESLIKSPNSPRNKSLTPKVILPTQNMDGSLAKDPHLGDNTPGILIAKTSSPVNLDVESTAQSLGKFNKSIHSLKAALTKAPVEKVSLKRSNSSVSNSDSNVNSSKKPAPEKAKKSSSVSAILPKPVTKASKKSTSNNNDSTRKKTASNRTTSTIKKESNTSSKPSTIKKENSSLSSIKASEKEKDKSGNGTDSKNSTNGVKKDPTAKSPKRLIAAPTVNSPKVLQATETKAKEPSILIDIPLYQADTNDYLDENGQVIFNLSTLIKEKYHPKNKELAQLKDSKRNLLMQLSDQSNGSLEKEKDEECDVIELDDDEDMEEDEGEIDTETNTVTTTNSPKKKSHPMKGKNLIGKYDVEDPFIDDSELLWEEQRAATKDGFFVYFGPLIEKGHYASLERANGTMKRGGVKNK
ncbi:Hpc2p [Saccharomyces paradoxus]|uniref:Hpc2p n=1 Tax=Saccharomyces paradoxus TaxID=27291 RepID=A0A8B8UMD5_SACPA|nr:Hpc2 [Saccharomyces paradoxus]QHS71774.1 Hpc2 [Saccharomyces paradoxus]